MISDICFEQIQGNFWYGQYGQFKVVMMKDSGYVNASKLCKDGGKLFKNWLANDSSKRLIQALEDELGHEASQSIKTENVEAGLTCGDQPAGFPASTSKALEIVHGGNYHEEGTLISGSYIHALLIPHVACWVSPHFSLAVSRIVNNFYCVEYTSKLAEAAQRELAVKDGQISSLRGDLVEVDAARVQVTEAFTKKRVDWDKWRQSHAFSLLQLHDTSAKYPFYVIRCKRTIMNARIKILRKKHPRAVVIFQHRKVPNGINLYNRLKVAKQIVWRVNYCMPRNSEHELLAAIREMCGADYPAEIHFPINLYAESLPSESPSNLFTQAPSYQPVATSTPSHVITYTPPSSPVIDFKPFTCHYCNKCEPSLLHLYIHQQACMFASPTRPPGHWSNPIQL
jgi:hypothetical protein